MSIPTEAGPALDRLVAQALLPAGEWYVTSARSDNVIAWRGNPWMPSTDIKAAWDVMEQMRALGWTIWIGPCADNGPRWDVQAKKRTNLHERTTADTAPMAICLAALRAVGPQ